MTALNIAHANFTIAAAFFSFIGFFSLRLWTGSRCGMLCLINGLLYSVLGYVWRAEAFYLLLPFFLLSVLSKVLTDRKTVRLSVLCLSVLLVLAAGLLYSKHTVDSSPEYADSIAYDDARSTLQDFPLHSYKDLSAEFEAADISENDYRVATDTLLADVDIETTEFLSTVSEIAGASFTFRPAEVLNEFLYDTSLLSLFSILPLSLLILLSFTFIFRCSSSPFVRMELLCSILGSAAILLFFLFMGRILDRIVYAVCFGCLLISLVHMLDFSGYDHLRCRDNGAGTHRPGCHDRKSYRAPGFKTSGIPAFCLSGLFLINAVISFSGNISLPQNVFNVTSGTDYGVCEALLDNKNIYIWDTYYMKAFVFDILIPQGKLYSEEFVDNNIPDGEWVYGQPYFRHYLSRIGVENPLKELLGNEHCYYISRQYRKDLLECYIQEHYAADTALIYTGDLIYDSENTMTIFKVKPENSGGQSEYLLFGAE